jgi:hypothetical protein
MLKADPYAEAYDAFTAALDPQTRDLVTKLMLHTRTRPDAPHMVGVCLTAIATIKNADAQTRMLDAQQAAMRALEDLIDDSRFVQGIERVSALTRALEAIKKALRYGTKVVGIAVGALALCWALSITYAWRNGYEWARSDIGGASHQRACDALNGYIASVSRYWRGTLRMPAAADRLAGTMYRDCPR